jgi:hypothetical protein
MLDVRHDVYPGFVGTRYFVLSTEYRGELALAE